MRSITKADAFHIDMDSLVEQYGLWIKSDTWRLQLQELNEVMQVSGTETHVDTVDASQSH